MCDVVTTQNEAIWQYWQGHSARQIGRGLGVNYRTATRYLNKFGGSQPAGRSCAKDHLSVDYHGEIACNGGRPIGRSTLTNEHKA